MLDGKYSILTSIDDTYFATATAFNLQGGQYKQMGEKTMGELCKNLYNETYREQFEKFMEHQEYAVPWMTCPWPTGPNEIHNYMMQDYGSYLPPYIPGGEKWRLEVRIMKDNVTLGGYNYYGILKERTIVVK